LGSGGFLLPAEFTLALALERGRKCAFVVSRGLTGIYGHIRLCTTFKPGTSPAKQIEDD
jgi:hypothetical protein